MWKIRLVRLGLNLAPKAVVIATGLTVAVLTGTLTVHPQSCTPACWWWAKD